METTLAMERVIAVSEFSIPPQQQAELAIWYQQHAICIRILILAAWFVFVLSFEEKS